jgi:hypothetical protein
MEGSSQKMGATQFNISAEKAIVYEKDDNAQDAIL